ncbi:hypothetical protein COO60DRAFT_1195885 [Scenedesmus sp. NREL 46B-D3]|nr:hypothetical protein COO60DRAFT_1195885 [Scenedesmus sp. NREL 46B-D3]
MPNTLLSFMRYLRRPGRTFRNRSSWLYGRTGSPAAAPNTVVVQRHISSGASIGSSGSLSYVTTAVSTSMLDLQEEPAIPAHMACKWSAAAEPSGSSMLASQSTDLAQGGTHKAKVPHLNACDQIPLPVPLGENAWYYASLLYRGDPSCYCCFHAEVCISCEGHVAHCMPSKACSQPTFQQRARSAVRQASTLWHSGMLCLKH